MTWLRVGFRLRHPLHVLRSHTEYAIRLVVPFALAVVTRDESDDHVLDDDYLKGEVSGEPSRRVGHFEASQA